MRHCFFYFFFFYLFFAHAQMNESDSTAFKADLSLTGFWQSGNVETLIFRAKSNLSWRLMDQWVYKNQNSYVYQEFGGEKADEDILSLNFLYLNPKKRFYPLALAFFSTNFRREIDLRYLVGMGATYQIIQETKSNKNWLKASLSTEFEQTHFNNNNFNVADYDGSDDIHTFRATLWVNGKYHLFNNKLIVTHESYVQPSLEQINNYRWQMDLGLEVPLWKFLNFKVNYLRTFESVVIEGQKREDQFLTFGFTIKSNR